MYVIQKIKKWTGFGASRVEGMQQGGGVIFGSKNRWDATTKQHWVCHSEKLWLREGRLCKFKSIKTIG